MLIRLSFPATPRNPRPAVAHCHECGHRANWWADGVTLPCGCGARTPAALLDARDAVRARLDAEASRRKAAA